MIIKRRSETDPSIPTSSMSDIAFLLIIFFMVTAVFSVTKGLAMRLPEADPGPRPDPAPSVFVEVRPDGVRVDCQIMGTSEILPYLEPILTANPGKPVILHTAGEASYSQMIEVYDLLAGTRAEGSPWPFVVNDIFVPTRRDLADYAATFGTSPFDRACP